MRFLCLILITAFLINFTETWTLFENITFCSSLTILSLLIYNCFEFRRKPQKKVWEYWNRCEKIITFPYSFRHILFDNHFFESHLDENHNPFHPDVSGFFLLTVSRRGPDGLPSSLVLWRFSLITKRYFHLAEFSEGPSETFLYDGSAVVNNYFFLPCTIQDDEQFRVGVWILNMKEGTRRQVFLDSPRTGQSNWAHMEFQRARWAGNPWADGSFYAIEVKQMTENRKQKILIYKYVPHEANKDRWAISRTATFEHSAEEFALCTGSFNYPDAIVFVLLHRNEGMWMRTPDSRTIVYNCSSNSWKSTTWKKVLEETQTGNVELKEKILLDQFKFLFVTSFHFMGGLFVSDTTSQTKEPVEQIYAAPNPSDPQQTDFFSLRLQPKSLKRRALEELIKNRPEVLHMNLEELRNFGIFPLAMAALATENESVSSQPHPGQNSVSSESPSISD